MTGSISAPGVLEAFEHRIPKEAPLRALFLAQGPNDAAPRPGINMLLRHGVRACLEYARHGDIAEARKRSNPNLSPHVSFVDMGGHGYTLVRATTDALEAEFMCIPRPIARHEQPDGGPLLYRVRHRTRVWRAGETPKLDQEIVEGNPIFSI